MTWTPTAVQSLHAYQMARRLHRLGGDWRQAEVARREDGFYLLASPFNDAMCTERWLGRYYPGANAEITRIMREVRAPERRERESKAREVITAILGMVLPVIGAVIDSARRR